MTVTEAAAPIFVDIVDPETHDVITCKVPLTEALPDLNERAEAEAELLLHRCFEGGGGASPRFRLELHDPVVLDPPRHYFVECDGASNAREAFTREHQSKDEAWALARELSDRHPGAARVIAIANTDGKRLGSADFIRGRLAFSDGDIR